MFKDCIFETALTTRAANNYFDGVIDGDAYKGDMSFVSTARAFLPNRMSPSDTLHVRFSQSSRSADTIATTDADSLIKGDCDRTVLYYNTFTIHSFYNPNKDANIAMLELMRAKFTSVYDGWEHLEQIDMYFSKLVKNSACEVACFVNRGIRSVVLFVDNLSYSKLHLIQGMMLGMMPWYHDKDKTPLTGEEKELLATLQKKDKDEYLRVIGWFASNYNFEVERLKKLLSDFETSYERTRLDEAKRAADALRSDFDEASRQIEGILRRMRDNDIIITGLSSKIKSEEGSANPEILSMFLDNPNLILENVDGPTMTFVYRGYLEFWDEDAAITAIADQYSDAYERERHFTIEQTRALLNAIFVDRSVKLRVCASFTFEIGVGVKANSHYKFGAGCENYMPNPHIQYYHCMGDNASIVNQALFNHDYTSALIQANASAQGLNFGDPTVMGRFYDDILRKDHNNKCFELPDGTITDSEGVVEWLEAQNKEENGDE